MTGAFHDLHLQLSPPLPSSFASVKPADPGSLGKTANGIVLRGPYELPDFWPLNNPDLNTVDYRIWGNESTRFETASD